MGSRYNKETPLQNNHKRQLISYGCRIWVPVLRVLCTFMLCVPFVSSGLDLFSICANGALYNCVLIDTAVTRPNFIHLNLSLNQPLNLSLNMSLPLTFTDSFTHFLTPSLAHSFTRSFTRSLAPSLSLSVPINHFIVGQQTTFMLIISPPTRRRSYDREGSILTPDLTV